jgi:hypothetical protein
VGLSSCGESTLRKDILGEWVGDPKILKNLEWMGGGQTKIYAFDWKFDKENRGLVKVGKTLTLREEEEEVYLRVAIEVPIIYNVYGDGLSFRFDKDSVQVEILECLINGKNYKDVVARDVEGEGEAALQRAYDTVTEQLKELVEEDVRRQIGTPLEITYSYDASVKNDILTLKQGGKIPLTFHRNKSQGATAP